MTSKQSRSAGAGEAGFSRRRAFALIAAPLAMILPLSAGWCSADAAPLTPERFGAKGDGRTDDTDAFTALSAYLNAHDGGIVDLRQGATYRVGRQKRLAGGYLAGAPILHAQNVSKFVVRMNGATLKFNDGLKFGAFNSGTGLARKTRLPHLVHADRADIGYAISAINVGLFQVSGGTIDCNSRKATIGGLWGDTGRQCIQAGVAAFSCGRVEWSGLRVIDSCLDGLIYGYSGLKGRQSPKPLLVRDVTVDRVGRNCVSVVGTNSALFERCTFQRAGEAPNDKLGSIISAPASCFDLEAEEAECRNVVIRACKLIAGRSSLTAFVADSGISSDILIEDTLLVGAVWTAKPRTTFNRCQVYGTFARLSGGHKDPRDNSRIIDCRISDSPRFEDGVTDAPHAIDLEGAGPGVVISGTTIDVAHTRLNLRRGLLRDVTINFATGADKIPERDYAILADGATFADVEIIDRIAAAKRPRDAFYITPPASARATILSEQSKLMWNSWSRGSNGYTGRYRG